MIPTSEKQTSNAKNTVIFKRVFDTKSIDLFKYKLHETSWDDIEASQNLDEAYKIFLISFLIYTTLTFLKNRSKEKVKICKVHG